MMPGSGWLAMLLVLVVPLLLAPALVHGDLYSPEEPLVSLDGRAHALLLGSDSSWIVEFYASWCGHCKRFKGTWSALAQDLQGWRPAIYPAALDCAESSNAKTCSDFGVAGYPTVMFFNAFAKKPSDGVRIKGQSVTALREEILDHLEAQKESPPPACPPLEPISAPELEHFFENNKENYLAVIFEENKKYMAKEVTMDMVQYQGMLVRRVVKDQTELVDKFNVLSFPTGFLFCRNGSVSEIVLGEQTRQSYSKYLRSLPGVKHVNYPLIGWSEKAHDDDDSVKKTADSSKVYMADLESAVHYSLRMEVSRFATLTGERLKALINYVNVLRKFFPARPYLRTLLNSLSSWLLSRSGKEIFYKDFEDVLNNKNQLQKAVLSSKENYVGCQGSKPEFRGYPCSLWTLFHMLTVQAADMVSRGTRKSTPREVLNVMRNYVQNFFGCEDCAKHFEQMAKESIRTVRAIDDATMWLWKQHNRVNARLAGAETEDPQFPKVQWPTPELCPLCQVKQENGKMSWDLNSVKFFLKSHFSPENIANDYMVTEEVLLKNQKKANERRQKRDVDDEQVKGEVIQSNGNSDNALHQMQDGDDQKSKAHSNEQFHQKPSIIRMKRAVPLPEAEKEILDLDSYGHSLFSSRSLQDSNLNKENRVVHPKVLLEPPVEEFDQVAMKDRLLKRGIDSKYLIGVVMESGEVNWKRRWMKMLEIEFSRMDISLCVVFYFLSSMCLLAMYLYMTCRKSCLRQRCVFPQV